MLLGAKFLFYAFVVGGAMRVCVCLHQSSWKQLVHAIRKYTFGVRFDASGLHGCPWKRFCAGAMRAAIACSERRSVASLSRNAVLMKTFCPNVALETNVCKVGARSSFRSVPSFRIATKVTTRCRYLCSFLQTNPRNEGLSQFLPTVLTNVHNH